MEGKMMNQIGIGALIMASVYARARILENARAKSVITSGKYTEDF